MNILKNVLYACIVISLFMVACFEGPQGPEGNANVKTVTFSVYSSEWVEDGARWEYIKNVSIITPDIYNEGVVLVYVKATDGNYWQSLPYTWPGTSQIIQRYWYAIGQVQLEYYCNDTLWVPTSNLSYKVVAIEGNIADRALSSGVNLNDYAQVEEYFNVK